MVDLTASTATPPGGGLINSGNVSSLFWPGLDQRFSAAQDRWETQYTVFMATRDSDKNEEINQMMGGFGLAQEKGEGERPRADTSSQGMQPKFIHKEWALSFSITENSLDDQQYEKYYSRAEDMAESLRQTEEELATDVLNGGFVGNTQQGGDGQSLFSTAHTWPGLTSTTYSNKLATPMDLSPAAMQSLITQINQAVDDRGLKQRLDSKCIIVPSALQFDIEVQLKSILESGEMNNDLNPLKSKSSFSDGYFVNRYLESDSAWYIKTTMNPDKGLIHYKRRAMRYGSDNDFLTKNAIFMADFRSSFGFINPLAMFASEGTGT